MIPSVRVQRGLPPGAGFLLVLVPILAWLMHNMLERPLDDEATALLAAPPIAVPDTENLFLAMAALPIAGGEPAHERGAAAVAAYRRAVERKKTPLPKTLAEALGRESAEFEEDEVRLCSTGVREGAYECLRTSYEQRPRIEALARRYQPLLARYDELFDYPRFANPLASSPDDPLIGATALKLSQFGLSGLALSVRDGAVNQALASLEASADLWRRVLVSPTLTVIDKMLASRALAAHTLFASELIRSVAVDTAGLSVLERVVRPLNDDERSMAAALANEFRLESALWSQLADPDSAAVRADLGQTPSWWYRIVFRTNDTIARSWRDLERVLALEKAGCPAVKTRLLEIDARPSAQGMGLAWHDWFYNPIGRILHASVDGERIKLQWIARQCNLLALQRMVGLQLELQRTGVLAEHREAAVQSLAARFTDPTTGGPFSYDPEAQTLGFDIIGEREPYLSPLPLAGR